MRKAILLAVVAVFVGAGVASAYDLNVAVSTDKTVYAPGETVYWTMYAWTSTDCPGIALLALNLNEDRGEYVNLPYITTYNPYPGIYLKELTGSAYLLSTGFMLDSTGIAGAGVLTDVVVRQGDTTRQYGAGSNDDPATVFAQGELVANVLGMHQLSMTINAANYWGGSSGDPLPALEMGEGTMTAADYEVIPEPATMGLLLLGALALIRRRR